MWCAVYCINKRTDCFIAWLPAHLSFLRISWYSATKLTFCIQVGGASFFLGLVSFLKRQAHFLQLLNSVSLFWLVLPPWYPGVSLTRTYVVWSPPVAVHWIPSVRFMQFVSDRLKHTTAQQFFSLPQSHTLLENVLWYETIWVCLGSKRAHKEERVWQPGRKSFYLLIQGTLLVVTLTLADLYYVTQDGNVKKKIVAYHVCEGEIRLVRTISWISMQTLKNKHIWCFLCVPLL